MSPPTWSVKLKIIYGLKMSKIGYLDIFIIQIFLHVQVQALRIRIIWLVATLKARGLTPIAPLNETLSSTNN
jgi:hypothetical protein